jgi:adenylate cyclase
MIEPASAGGQVLTNERTTSGDEEWRRILTGEARGRICWNPKLRRLMRSVPSEPRCKLCDTPFGRPGSLLFRLVGFGPSRLNRRLCGGCIRALEKRPGGAEVELSLLFVDVRGSTALAEQTSAGEFSRLMAGFYGLAAAAIDRWDGIVDKFVGDQVVALFIPRFAGCDHAARAVAAARELVGVVGRDEDGSSLPLGAAVHTGTAYVGTVGEGDAWDFTALGDAVNTAARLAAEATTGEILVSAAAAAAAGLDTAGLETRRLSLRGRAEHVDVWGIRTAGASSPAARQKRSAG